MHSSRLYTAFISPALLVISRLAFIRSKGQKVVHSACTHSLTHPRTHTHKSQFCTHQTTRKCVCAQLSRCAFQNKVERKCFIINGREVFDLNSTVNSQAVCINTPRHMFCFFLWAKIHLFTLLPHCY